MKQTNIPGALLCARYAFAPNLYSYCGPDSRGDIGGYLTEELSDKRLVEHLAKFETLFPYLQAIAQANGIADPLDSRVVEAYWVGNNLLEKVTEQETYRTLMERQQLAKRLPKKKVKWLLPKIDKQARLHHSFHVLNVFTRTGHRMVAQTVETMDECRISHGEILDSNVKTKVSPLHQGFVGQAKLKLKSQKLIYLGGKLRLIPCIREVIVVQEALAKRLKLGDFVSVHWGIVCDKLTDQQVKQLKSYTENHVKLANETI